MAERIVDYKTLGNMFDPLVKEAAAQLYTPPQSVAELHRKDVERVMLDLAFQVYDRIIEGKKSETGE